MIRAVAVIYTIFVIFGSFLILPIVDDISDRMSDSSLISTLPAAQGLLDLSPFIFLIMAFLSGIFVLYIGFKNA